VAAGSAVFVLSEARDRATLAEVSGGPDVLQHEQPKDSSDVDLDREVWFRFKAKKRRTRLVN